MVLADLNDLTGKFMAHDGGVFGDIRVDPLVGGAQNGAFVGGHTDRVGNHFDQNFVVGDGGQLKFIQTEIPGSMQSYSFRFHVFIPP